MIILEAFGAFNPKDIFLLPLLIVCVFPMSHLTDLLIFNRNKKKYLLTLSISSFIIELKKYVIYTWREIVRFCFILNIQILLVLNANVRHQPIHCHTVSCLHQEYIHIIYIHEQQSSQASYLISSCFISQALSRLGKSWHLRLFITLLLKKSGLVQGSLKCKQGGLFLWSNIKTKQNYSMGIMGQNGPPVPMKTSSQLEVEVSTAQSSQRWENLGFHFPRHWPARGPPGVWWIKPLARELRAKSSVLIDARITASRWFYQLVEFIFRESSFPGMKQTQSIIIHHLSSVWERWYDLFTCNEAWPYCSRDFLKRGMCQLTNLSHEWNHKQIFSSPPIPPFLPVVSSVTICAVCYHCQAVFKWLI